MRETERHFQGTPRFHIIRVVGEGGMGVVYEALDTERGVKVALKTLHALSAEGLLSFKREFRDFQDLQHTNLVNLGELYCERDQWFFTMELLEGRSFLDAVAGKTISTKAGPDSSAPTERLAVPATPAPIAEGAISVERAPPKFDEALLREWLRQLSRGLIALHDAGKVHRDIKPSNVLVTTEGRVVLLDYGVATNAVATGTAFEATIVGTVAYMAPEQAAGHTVGPEADWYSVGVVLFEALSGALPIFGQPMALMESKQTVVPPLASSINPAVPADLDALCADLLQIDPRLRPTGRQLLDRLGGRRRRNLDGPVRHTNQLIGRTAELASLETTLSGMTGVNAASLSLMAASGLGKTMLARQFLGNVSKRSGVLVLSGACFEREAVPYNGVDGLMDALSIHLGRISPTEAAALVPSVHAYLLTKAFPVLSTSDAFAAARKPDVETPDPQELRKQLFGAIRELFLRLSRSCTLVLFIDDLQWLGPDSAALLTELTRPPQAPPILWLSTVRAETEEDVAAWEVRLTSMLGLTPKVVRLERLGTKESGDLARSLVSEDAARTLTDEHIQAVARESGGHPLFIDELMRQAAGETELKAAAIDLDQAIWRRVSSLDEEMQSVVTLLTLTPRRLTQAVLAQATNVEPARWNKVLTVLRASHLVRTHGMRASDAVEPYHDRIRTAVRGHLPPATAVLHHRRLAETLESEAQRDIEALTFHWAEAGESARASDYALEAANKANSALSFDRAAEFYRKCIELTPGRPLPAVWAQLGDALVNAGRGAQGADAYSRAAELEPAPKRLDLQRLAAEHYLRSGHIDQGIQLMKEVLAAVDISTPRTPQGALIDLLWNRAKLRFRGLKYSLQANVNPKSAQKLDATWSASNGFSMVDPIRGANFQTQNLLLALKVGAPESIANALAMEAAFIACEGASQCERAEDLVSQAETLSRALPTERSLGLTKLVRGVIAFQNGQWMQANRWLSVAASIFSDRCTGVTWERDSCTFFQLAALFYLGKFNDLQEAVPRLLVDADSRGDLFAGSNARLSTINSVWLSLDQPQTAKTNAELAFSRWSNLGYMAHSYYYFVAHVNRLLYEDKVDEAWSAVENNWGLLKRSLLLRVQVVRVEANHLRARAGFAKGGDGMKPAMASLVVLEKEGVPYATAMARLLRASAEMRKGRKPTEVVEILRDANQLLQAADMNGYALAAQWAIAQITQNAAAAATIRNQCADLGIQSPDRLLSMLGIGKFTSEIVS